MLSTQTWTMIAEKLPGHADRRRCERVLWTTPITVSVAGGDGGASCTDKTSTIDFSMIGISFAWRQPIKPGTAISVGFENMPRQADLTATVRDCTHVRRAHYRVGAEFIAAYDDVRR